MASEVGLQYLAQVFIHVSGMNAAVRSRIVDILEQLVARNALALPHNPGEPRILQRDVVYLVTLAAKVKAHFAAKDSNVPAFSVVNPNEPFSLAYSSLPTPDRCHLEQAHNSGDHFLP